MTGEAFVNTIISGVRMDFKAATNKLSKHVGLRELAEELGVSANLLFRARMKPNGDSYRSPPRGWEQAASKLARRRAKELEQLAKQLEKAAGK